MLNSAVLTYFPNFSSSRVVLKQMLTQLLLYYTRFLDIIKKMHDVKHFTGMCSISISLKVDFSR